MSFLELNASCAKATLGKKCWPAFLANLWTNLYAIVLNQNFKPTFFGQIFDPKLLTQWWTKILDQIKDNDFRLLFGPKFGPSFDQKLDQNFDLEFLDQNFSQFLDQNLKKSFLD